MDEPKSVRAKRIAEIETIATEVFGDAGMARSWLKQKNLALGATPLSMLDSAAGVGEVRKILASIARGGVV